MEVLEGGKRKFPEDDVVVSNIYEAAKQVDRIMTGMPVEDHAAVLGMVQVTAQRRMHAHQTRQQEKQQAAQAEQQRQAKFSPN